MKLNDLPIHSKKIVPEAEGKGFKESSTVSTVGIRRPTETHNEQRNSDRLRKGNAMLTETADEAANLATATGTHASARAISQRLNQVGNLFAAFHFNHAIVERDYVGVRNMLVGITKIDLE
ncbi:hypothetical protein TNCV_517211 [Trichonephila clavipes]|nr:hypothetical protein TNCV_517211 [Trichonephila clavipes]